MSILFFFVNLPFSSGQIADRAHQFHSWFYYVGDHKISERWGIHPEIQFRRTGFANKPQQFLLRTAVNYHPDDRLMVSLGYVYAKEFPYGVFPSDFEFPEHRIYQQLEFEHEVGIFDFLHRTRLEQRWIADIVGEENPDSKGGLEPVHKGWPLQHRARYSFEVNMPLQGTSIDDDEFFLYASNELFFSFGGSTSNEFDQNRSQLGLGYQIKSFGRLELGYLYQTILDPDRGQVENNHTLILAWISRFNFK